MYFAVLSGCFAALGSLFGKLSSFSLIEDYLLLRGICVVLMLLSNACVMHNYVKALHQCNSTILATLISTATNYIVSVLAGMFVFGEAISLLWWTGFSFIVVGLTLIVKEENKKDASGSFEADGDKKLK